MLAGGVGWTLDDFLLLGLAVLFGGFCYVSAVQGFRSWSENRRITNHFRH